MPHGQQNDVSSCNNGAIGLAHYMQNLGAYDAINLDGGGSTGMWIKKSALGSLASQVCQTVSGAKNPSVGCFVNRPTTNGSTIAERARSRRSWS